MLCVAGELSVWREKEECVQYLFGISHFPEGTPNRFQLVAEFVGSQPKELNTAVPSVCLGGSVVKNGKHLHLTDKTNCRFEFSAVQTQREKCLQAGYSTTCENAMLQQEHKDGQLSVIVSLSVHNAMLEHCFVISARNAK